MEGRDSKSHPIHQMSWILFRERGNRIPFLAEKVLAVMSRLS